MVGLVTLALFSLLLLFPFKYNSSFLYSWINELFLVVIKKIVNGGGISLSNMMFYNLNACLMSTSYVGAKIICF